MRDSTVARRLRAIAGHADHLLIAALILAKLAGVEVHVGRREAQRPEPAAGAMEMPAHGPPGAMHLMGLDVHRAAADGGACARAQHQMPRAESRRERARRARVMLFGATPDGRPRPAG
ncbi:MAG TPA: hypothetical protein VKA84_05080 [Gemmatimonadaceae bacterium]|nr:hypothetical protein [Gemmatimonadaceae bacterium]